VTSCVEPRRGKGIIGDIVVELTGMDYDVMVKKVEVWHGVNFITHDFNLSFLAPAGPNLVNLLNPNSKLCPPFHLIQLVPPCH
jgi:hypothetical protein